MYAISSAVKHCNSKLTSLLPARNTLQVIKQPTTPLSMVWLLEAGSSICLFDYQLWGNCTVYAICAITKPPLLQGSRLIGGGSPNLMGAANGFHWFDPWLYTCNVQTADLNWFWLLLLRLYSVQGFSLYEAPCETAGLRAEPSLSQKDDPLTAGPVHYGVEKGQVAQVFFCKRNRKNTRR